MTSPHRQAAAMTWSDVCARRLKRHGLAAPVVFGQLAQQVGVICGAHAQVMSAAELSISLRVADATPAAVREALWTQRSLVKTIGPRGTVHLVAASDLPMWAGALAAVRSPVQGLPPEARLTPQQSDAVVSAIAEALADAELTIDELDIAVAEMAGAWASDLVMPAFGVMWPRWRQAIHEAAQRGALCFGPNRGPKVTYTSPRRWLPGFEPMDAPRALGEVVRRYLLAYGPATPQQFGRWLGIGSARRTTDLFAALSGELERVTLQGIEAWVVAGDALATDGPPRGVRLLPYFDAYVVGCHPRDLVFPGPAQRALSGGQAGNLPVLLIDGVAGGVWHLRRTGRTLGITVEPCGSLTAGQRHELDVQVERIGELLGGVPQLTIGALKIGPHA